MNLDKNSWVIYESLFEEEKKDVDKIWTQLVLTYDCKKVTIGIFAKLKKITVAQSLYYYNYCTMSNWKKKKKNHRCTSLFIATVAYVRRNKKVEVKVINK